MNLVCVCVPVCVRRACVCVYAGPCVDNNNGACFMCRLNPQALVLHYDDSIREIES